MTGPGQADIVQRVTVGGTPLLWYKAPAIQVAVLRGTTADTDGNISFEREAMFCDNLNQVGLEARLSCPLIMSRIHNYFWQEPNASAINW